MNYTKRLKLIVTAGMAISMLTACGNNGADGTNSNAAANADAAASNSETTSTGTNASNPAADNGAAPDPMGKYDEPVTVTEVIGYNPPEDPRTPQGLTPDKNAYLKDLKEMLNIEVEYKWMVPSNQFEQKFSLAMASGDLPDIMDLDQKTFEKLRKQGVLADLTEAYNQYASPVLKKYMESDGGFAMKAFSADGKQYGIPSFEDPFLSTQLLWIRKDWLDNLSLQPPKTIDDLEKVAEAFVNNDPDKNGASDTYGLALQKNLFYWGFDTRGLFNGFGAYPSVGDGQSAWIKGSDGTLVPGLTQPEVKAALSKMQSWYKKGIIDKEFALKDENKVSEDIVGSKVGISYGEWWYPNWPLNLNMDKDPKANWIPLQIPSLTGPGKSLVPKLRGTRIVAVNKSAKNPEAAVKMINFFFEMGKKQYIDKNQAANGYVYNWFNPRIYNPSQIDTIYTEVNKALDAKQSDISLDDDNYKIVADVFKAANDFLNKSTANASAGVNWGQYFSRAAKDGGWGITRTLKEQQQYVNNEFFGVPTETQIEKGGQLDKLMAESFTKIVMGGSIDEFDKFVNSWKSLGGDQITKEVNDWYQTVK